MESRNVVLMSPFAGSNGDADREPICGHSRGGEEGMN